MAIVLATSGLVPVAIAQIQSPLPQPPQAPSIVGKAGILIDQVSGQVLWAKNPDLQLAPASTTKILTALLAIENCRLEDTVVVSQSVVGIDGTSVYLKPGEKHSLRDLLYAMLLNSANDAAVAIAEHVAGSVPRFVEMMNQKAASLGATHSHFVTPNGLPAPGHYTTARDLATIARVAMQNPTFRQIVATKTYHWQGQEWQTTLINTNKLLASYSGSTGIKTGYTSEAGQCLVGSASRGGRSYLAVVLGSSGNNVWSDVARLLDYGFNNFSQLQLVKAGEIVGSLKVNGKEVAVQAKDSLVYSSPAGQLNQVNYRLVVDRARLPLKAGDQLGHLVVSVNGQQVGVVPAVSASTVTKPLTWTDWWLRLTYLLAGVWAVKLVLTFRKRRLVSRNYPTLGRDYLG